MRGCFKVSLVLTVSALAACSSQPSRQRAGVQSLRTGNSYHDNLLLSQDRRYRSSHDSVPDGPPPDFSKLPEPVPKAEPLSLYGNKSPYTVLGHTYTVLPTAHGYVERGTASYYGSKFHRYKTSTLEDYDMYGYSAAHKTLPLPSYVRVTNLKNGKSVVVRVNDRGPFKDDRLIDLSYIAAVKIGIWPSGTGEVEVRALDPGSPPPPQAVAKAPDAVRAWQAISPAGAARNATEAMAPVSRAELPMAGTGGRVTAAVPAAAPTTGIAPAAGLYLQAGAFGDRANAERVAARIRSAGIAAVQIVPGLSGSRSVLRVRVGPLADPDAAALAAQRIVQLGLPRPQPAVN
ncbi:septal ring lytic transglycosylase RlpA family protein [Frateuria aurantia]